MFWKFYMYAMHDHIFESGNHFYPRYLDMPNSTLRNDIVLGVWNND